MQSSLINYEGDGAQLLQTVFSQVIKVPYRGYKNSFFGFKVPLFRYKSSFSFGSVSLPPFDLPFVLQ